jgi:hypothetical protein
MTVHTTAVKIAISVPDELSLLVERWIRRARTSRSRFFAVAAAEFLARHATSDDPTDAWNRALARAGQPGDEPAARAFRRRSKRIARQAAARTGERW